MESYCFFMSTLKDMFVFIGLLKNWGKFSQIGIYRGVSVCNFFIGGV